MIDDEAISYSIAKQSFSINGRKESILTTFFIFNISLAYDSALWF
jgi:hypothetical protein